MSLLRLLTTGKSLVGFGDTEGRYQLTTQRLLPHFGSAKNPFLSRGESDQAQAEGGSKGIPEGDVDCCNRSAPNMGQLADRQAVRQEPKLSAKVGVAGRLLAMQVRAAAFFTPWSLRLKNLLNFRRPENPKPAIPRFTKPPVQGELSLDTIRVVRNDLSDADLEVIAAKVPEAPAGDLPDLQPVPQATVVGSRWGRVRNRIFGAGKT
jgi:hypothetical protein